MYSKFSYHDEKVHDSQEFIPLIDQHNKNMKKLAAARKQVCKNRSTQSSDTKDRLQSIHDDNQMLHTSKRFLQRVVGLRTQDTFTINCITKILGQLYQYTQILSNTPDKIRRIAVYQQQKYGSDQAKTLIWSKMDSRNCILCNKTHLWRTCHDT